MQRSLLFKGLFILMIGFSLLNSGCSSFGELFGDDKKNEENIPVPPVADAERPPKEVVKFSDTPNVMNPSNRQYRRTTRAKIEEESDLGSQAGSMWVGEGQGAYLFSQNKSRREGDVLNVKLEGAAQKQVETKVAVIKKLLKQLEEEELKSQSVPIPNQAETADPKKPAGDRAPASAAPAAEKEEPLDIGSVPTKITERQPDGNYRIKGVQPFMIGKREYKVIVTGLIRPEDFNDEGVGSNKLLDPQFDVVSLRRNKEQ